jgi:hypothetical protein
VNPYHNLSDREIAYSPDHVFTDQDLSWSRSLSQRTVRWEFVVLEAEAERDQQYTEHNLKGADHPDQGQSGGGGI